jgi:phosphoglucomutase
MESISRKYTHTIQDIETTPFSDQNPGTSGLRKKVTVYQQKHYIENFTQSIFNAHSNEEYQGKSLVVGGDGRYYNDAAINIIIRVAVANGITKIILAENGIMSTPAMSMLVRVQPQGSCFGAVILTASHNPGGEHEDLGIKFNNSAGAPALEAVTGKIFSISKEIKSYRILNDLNQKYDLQNNSIIEITGSDNKTHSIEIQIEPTTKLYVQTMQELFDFDKIKSLLSRKDFKLAFDAMHGASGPYAIEIFNKILKVDLANLYNCDSLPDFGGLHPDPNLTYAKNIVKVMNINGDNPNPETVPDFGAACDGDADRNMILGKQFFIAPSDSLAIIAANYKLIKNLSKGLSGVARSMPTSSSLDRVAKKLGLDLFETPTGWKFFGNLMDAGLINLCGEESFGTGSDHIREKDGLWAVLAWLSILAEMNSDHSKPLVTVRDIAVNHWKNYGRDYYIRFDYEGLKTEEGNLVVKNIESNFEHFKNEYGGEAYIFEYNDVVDKSVSKNQGWIFKFKNGSRIIFRVSGTSSAGATIRIYMEKYVPADGDILEDTLTMIKHPDNDMAAIALKFSQINEITGRSGPTVIT